MRVLYVSAAVYDESSSIVNYGDEALSRSLHEAISKKLPADDVVRAVHGLNERHAADRTVPARPIHRLIAAVWKSDFIVIGGGTLYQHSIGLLYWQVLLATLVRLTGKKLAISHVGAEGLRNWSALLTRYVVASAQTVSVRDVASAECLLAATGRRPFLSADAMFLDEKRDRAMPLNSRVAVNLKNGVSELQLERLVSSLHLILEPGESVYLFPFDTREDMDSEGLRRFESTVNGRFPVQWCPSGLEPEALMTELRSCRLAVGIRLHFTIFAALCDVPVCALGTEPKAQSFARDADLSSSSLDADSAALVEAIRCSKRISAVNFEKLANRAKDGLDLIVV